MCIKSHCTIAPESHTGTQQRQKKNYFANSLLVQVTGLVMQTLKELERNARSLAATESQV